MFAENRARMPQVQNLAKQIIYKWDRLNEADEDANNYDPEGGFEGQYF